MIRQAKWRGTAMVRYLKCKSCGCDINVGLTQQIPSTGYECQSCERKKKVNRTAIQLT